MQEQGKRRKARARERERKEDTMLSRALISRECISSGQNDEEEGEVSGTQSPPLSYTLYSYSLTSSPPPSSMDATACGLYNCWGHWLDAGNGRDRDLAS